MAWTHPALVVANQKGGVAKTTTAATLAVALAELGERVLLVDLDPQACLTFSLGLDPEDLTTSVTDVLAGRAGIEAVVVGLDAGSRARDGVLDLVPATIGLAEVEAVLAAGDVESSARTLRDALRRVHRRYDRVLIDAPPSLGVLTVNALTAADQVLVPLQCETLSHRGLGQLLDTVHDVRRRLNRSLRVRGVLPTMFDGRTRHAHAVLDDVVERYRIPALPAIPRSVRFAEAPATGQTVLETARRTRGAQAYLEIAAVLHAEGS